MLFGSNTLEIAIGLTFVYVLLALVCSTLNEWIAGIFGLRAKTLREGIANLLEDPDAQGLAKQFFEHPLIRGLARKGKEEFPSYISAGTFVAALLDIAFPSSDSPPASALDVYQRVRARLEELSASNNDLARTLLIQIDQAGINPGQIREATLALQQVEQVRASLLEFAGQLNAAQLGTLAPLVDTLDKFQELEVTLKQAEDSAKLAFVRAQDNVERYYDQAMQRVSGWYKRRAQVIIIVLAVIVTGVLNADTIAIANKLSLDPVLRSQIADTASLYVQQNEGQPPAATSGAATPVAASLAGPASNSLSNPSGSTSASTTSTSVRPSTQISQTLATLTGLGLPLGWTALPATAADWVYKLAGLIVTIVAVSLGAPFWFELLNKLVNLRMSGSKPAPAAPKVESPTSSVLESRLFPPSVPIQAALAVGGSKRETLAELAAHAVRYVEDLKQTRMLSVPDRDIAMAWMLVETTNRNLPASPDEIVGAIDEAFRLRQ